MNKSIPIIFIVLCLAVLAVPALGIAVWGPSEAGANEILSASPVLVEDDGTVNTEFLSDLADYVSDHFFLRQELITARSSLTASVFGVSTEENVILGEDGWLYYSSTLGDYTGTGNMTVRELYSIANNLSLLSEYAEANGATLVFAAAPNKNSVYGENMPDYGVISQYHNLDAVLKLLDGMDVSYADLALAFESEDETLYFEHDSHWNSRGAALAADEINALFGINSDYFDGDFSESESHTGDLFEMLYPTLEDSETNPVYGGELTLDYENSNVRADSITINVSGAGELRLLAYRDSFGNLLYPYLGDSFSWSRFSRSTIYDLTLIEEYDIDCVLIELVERNLDYLLTYTPVIVSPARDIALPESVSGTVTAGFDTGARAPDGYVAFSGTVEDADSYSPVYVEAGGTCFEALLGEDGAFTVYLEDSLSGCECRVLYELDGELVMSKTAE